MLVGGVEGSAVYLSHQQCLIDKWLGLSVTVTVSVRARARECIFSLFYFFWLC